MVHLFEGLIEIREGTKSCNGSKGLFLLDRFVSLLVYVPRDRYSTEVRYRIGDFLAESYNGRVSAYYPFFPEGPLVRIHFIIGRYEGKTPEREPAELEERINDIIRTWADRLKEVIYDQLGPAEGRGLADQYLSAFRAGYQVTFSPERALKDIAQLQRLDAGSPVAVNFYAGDEDEPAEEDNGPQKLRKSP